MYAEPETLVILSMQSNDLRGRSFQFIHLRSRVENRTGWFYIIFFTAPVGSFNEMLSQRLYFFSFFTVVAIIGLDINLIFVRFSF